MIRKLTRNKFSINWVILSLIDDIIVDIMAHCQLCWIANFSAMNNLDKLKLWGKQIKVTPSKHNIVQMPKEGQPVSYQL